MEWYIPLIVILILFALLFASGTFKKFMTRSGPTTTWGRDRMYER